jgi:hypothetical protein
MSNGIQVEVPKKAGFVSHVRGGFTYKEIEREHQKEVHTIYGNKGCGKTNTAYSYPGIKYVLSFDRKSQRVKEGMYNNNPDIRIIDSLEYEIPSEEEMTKSASDTFDYAIFTLNEITNKRDCDWIVVDGLERLATICEMKMRYEEKLGPFQPFGNLTLWKKRRMFLRQFHTAAINAARKGVIYCTYVATNREVEEIEEGRVQTKQKEPAWVDIVKEETDFVIYVYTKQDKDQMRWYAHIESSKIPKRLTSGQIQEVTNKGITFNSEV